MNTINDRINIETLIIDNKNEITEGTSALNYTINPVNNKKCILKQNDCMIGITNEDLREKAASLILKLCNIDCAEIDLAIDNDGNKYCLSYNVLKDNQIHICLDEPVINENNNKDEIFITYFNDIKNSIINLPEIKKDEARNIFIRILEIYLMDTIINHNDRKMENCKIIYDNNKNGYLKPICYDYGVAFSKNSIQKNGLFRYLNSNEILERLISNFPYELNEIINNINNNLTIDNLINIFKYKELNKLDSNTIIKDIMLNINELDMLYNKCNNNVILHK